MSDYIKKEDAIKEVRKGKINADNEWDLSHDNGIDKAIRIIKSLSPADVIDVTQCKKCFYAHHHSKANSIAERKHGEWKHDIGDKWYCSYCLNVIHTDGSWEKPTDKFCKECGADMRGM